MNQVQEYRRRALTFRQIAMETPERDQREAIRKIADAWAKMAGELERREDAKRK